ncbi:hypothetical protein HPP92_026771 [Vanilla planifolia]|uniref:Uncharacterized protein n=1 Tax=Vanilla planifolia TaxID=51239 RepID=A0A835PBZ1_VANPL|nr:hypothetical protein HPP92_026962 [Vanilla planifolia]KAG0450360.1 hypothetical protein HPP92_026771 [Vanilla planifolia]
MTDVAKHDDFTCERVAQNFYPSLFRADDIISKMPPSDIASKILGFDFSMCPDLSKASLGEQKNDVTSKLCSTLERLRKDDPSHYQLACVVRQGEQPRESSLLLSKLHEDQVGGGSNYADWILQLHRQSQSP